MSDGKSESRFQDEIRAGNHILRRFFYGDGWPWAPRWELSRITAEGETVVAKGVGHDLRTIREAVKSLLDLRGIEQGRGVLKAQELGKVREPPELKLIVNANRELVEAVIDEDRERVSACLARGADVNARIKSGETPLFMAVQAWFDPAMAKLLVARGADVHVRDDSGNTPLHRAALFGDEARIGLLLKHGAEIDVRDDIGRTPLHRAAGVGRVKVTAFLVSRGADCTIRDHQGRTPADLVQKNDLMGPMREPLKRVLEGRGPRLVYSRPSREELQSPTSREQDINMTETPKRPSLTLAEETSAAAKPKQIQKPTLKL